MDLPPKTVCLAAVQAPLGDDVATNVARLSHSVEAAADHGGQVILLPELLEGPYFCQGQDEADFARARPFAGHPTLAHFQEVARRRQVVLVVSFFERDHQVYYNSVAVIDADGRFAVNDRGGFVYRKSHIPQGPGYEEKFFFRPGNTGLTTWATRFARLGVGICWDQWFPEAARAMALRGAEVLLYPTAIGSEPAAPELDTQAEWQLAMRGHAVHNRIPVVAANRIGTEGTQTFYGGSFVSDSRGQLLDALGRNEAGIAYGTVDLTAIARERAVWGLFRDRRPDLYGDLVAP